MVIMVFLTLKLTNFLVGLNSKLMRMTSKDKFKSLKSIYFTSDTSTHQTYKSLN